MTPLPSDLGRRFSERVRRQLADRPLEIEPAEHRTQLAKLLAEVGELSHYDLLGLPTDARLDEVHAAYERLARLVHPSHAPGLGLAGREAALELLFEHATEAYLVLSHPDRRRDYDREVQATSGDTLAARRRRGEESKRMARRYYRRALELVDEEEFHFAIELLKQAIRADSRTEYHALLGEVQLRNPNWMRQAADTFRNALDATPDSPRLLLGLGRACEGLGRWEEARRCYRRVAESAPGEASAEAREGLGRLAELEGGSASRKRRRSLLGRKGPRR